MKKNTKKHIGIILCCVIAACLAIWGGAVLKCELLTRRYGDQFLTAYREDTMIGDFDRMKVLRYSDTSSRVYYVTAEHQTGEIVTYEKQGDDWIVSGWDTVWAQTGSADGFIWPYTMTCPRMLINEPFVSTADTI